ncbi:MAG: PrsW family glutamic-type intramembrane protease [Sphaerochaetaceae bacterium]|jgi:RsiW-degrading membrane proteinase PrsW (M82 family)|nr:PrsW family glutamic-type intramembrane protease [Sphaerochaetaceae bacterium]
MFFILPARLITIIYLLAALVPGFFLLRYVYRKDLVDKESPVLLGKLLLQGVLAALASIILEMAGQVALNLSLSQSNPYYVMAMAFLVVAVVEEGTKFFFLKRKTWNLEDFDYTFDGIVYAVFVSMGFALFENVKYVFSFGLSVAFPRAFLAVPAHMGFAVFMGLFYGRAKMAEARGNKAAKTANLVAGYVSSVALHGFYDACVMKSTALSTTLFVVFVVLMYVVVIRIIKRESRQDRPII